MTQKEVFEISASGWHPEAGREVKKLGAALARHTGQEEGEAVSHIWSRMGILLQRGNAAILGNRIPALPGALIDGIIGFLNSLSLLDDHCVNVLKYMFTKHSCLMEGSGVNILPKN